MIHQPSTFRMRVRPAHRHGFTFMEVLLVLTILLVMAAITWPSLHRAWADHKIKEATEMVRTELGRTRNRAIDAVLIYEFRYELGGNRFLVIPHESDQMLSESVDASGQTGTGQQLVRVAGILRDGVRFAATLSDTASLGIPEIEVTVPVADWQLQGLPNAEELAGLKWSEPLLFYPDGSAAQSRLRLEDESGQLVELSVRGLTGAVSSMAIREESRL